MGKNKERWYPDKKQNHYGKECFWYEKDDSGHGWCSAPYIDLINPLKTCNGNRHNCCKIRFGKMDRMSDKQKINYWKREEELEKINKKEKGKNK